MTDIIVAKYQKGGTRFEVVIDPEKASLFRQGKATLADALRSPSIFTDAKKGEHAGSVALKKAFGTDDETVVAEKILREAILPQSKTQRAEQYEQVRNRLIDLVHRAGVDPRSHAPHPRTRIEAAMNEAKVQIDVNKTADAQLQDVLHALRPIIPIKSEMHTISVEIPAEAAGAALKIVKGGTKVIREEWTDKGDLRATVQIPGGLSVEFQDNLMKATHGKAQFTVIKRD